MMNSRFTKAVASFCFVLAMGFVAAGASAGEAVPAGSGIKAEELPLGTVFLNAAAMSLYIYDNDKASGKSVCVDKCAATWPPLLAEANAQPLGPWTLASRDDGSKQWAFEGSPVYTYIKDKFPGLAVGEGVQDIWHLAMKPAPRPRNVVYRGTPLGRVAADLTGKTLYSRDGDTAGQGCSGACLQDWIPLRAPGAALAFGDWSIVERADDGSPQWAYKGQPVYRYAADASPGSAAGDGVQKVWHAVVMEPVPPMPSWIKIGQSEIGPVFTDERGISLYTVAVDLETYEKIACHEDCVRQHFLPVLAHGEVSTSNAPGSNWGVMVNPDGETQWAYRGQLVYTFVSDKAPGDITGLSFGSPGVATGWSPIAVSTGFLPML